MASKPASILFKFVWKQFVPDCRAYKPSAPVIEVNYSIGVDVPLKHEFIHNSTEIIQAQLSASEAPEPNLTPLGMRYIIDQFEQVMVNPDVSTDAESTDWDEGEDEKPTAPATTKKPAPKVDKEEDWEDAPAETTTKTDEDWDENWEV